MKNKSLLLPFFIAFLMCLGVKNTWAQDTIYKRNGDIIVAQLLEVTPQLIKFKKIELPDGPIYSLERKELFMIRYKNGTKDLFLDEKPVATDDYAVAPIPKKRNPREDMRTDSPISIDGYHYSIGYFSLSPKKVDELILSKNDKPLSLMVKSAQSDKHTSKLLAFAPIPLGVGSYITLIAGSISAGNYGAYPTNYLAFGGILAVAALGTGITSIVLNVRSKKMRKEAVMHYNLTYFGSR
ncbi:MAG: hypothetical protein IPP32_10260 [Bacteroidetes bacterium]|nr:hypothetical protein [Bacteroidota bacterium]